MTLRKSASRPKERWAMLVAMVATLVLAVGAVTLAVHATGAFELDGDATTTSSDDWDEVCYEVAIAEGLAPADATARCTASNGTTGAAAVSWANDGALNATIFTGGGSKDPQPIGNWAWKDQAGGLPDKDNLLHSYAARYSLSSTDATGNCPNGTDPYDAGVPCDVIYFGADRYDNSGDAHMAFWFLQDEVGLGSNKIGGGTGFTGDHINGDVLAIANFSNGGTTATITILQWDTTCLSGVNNPSAGQCADANLRLLATAGNALCAPALDDSDPFCGIVNSDTITMPWSFTDKSGTPNNGALNGEFFEAGLNLSTLGLADRCFSTVVAETRSSTSTTATLKDFVIGKFAVCGATLTTAPDSTQIDLPGTVTDSATITVTGTATPPAPTGEVSFLLCGPSSTVITSCSPSDSPTAAGTADLAGATVSGNTYTVESDEITLSAPGYYCFFATWPGDGNYTDGPYTDGDSSECFTVRQPTSVTTELHETDSGGTDVVPPNNGLAISINAGSYVTDYASVTPTSATGTVDFRYYTSVEACQADTDGTGGTGAGADKAVSSGTATSDTVQFSSPGTFWWRAFFDGTDPLILDSVSECNEILTVIQLQPTMDTVQNFVPNDAATITVSDMSGGALAGSVVFKLYVGEAAAECTGTPAYESSAIDIPGPDSSGTDYSQTVMSANETAYTSSMAFSWVVEYTSTNGAHKNVTSGCGNETSSITIDNGSTAPTPTPAPEP